MLAILSLGNPDLDPIASVYFVALAKEQHIPLTLRGRLSRM